MSFELSAMIFAASSAAAAPARRISGRLPAAASMRRMSSVE
jgi:hypothetical protein